MTDHGKDHPKTLPEGCPLDPLATYPENYGPGRGAADERRGLNQKFTVADIIKILLILFGLAAGWFRMESRIDAQVQEVVYVKDRMQRTDEVVKSTKEELRAELGKINDKLDRLIEERRGRSQ